MRQSALALLMTALLVMPAEAQQRPQTREGFWISFGLGYGSLGCDDCGDERESGTSAYLRMGGTLTQRLLIGGEINGWSKTEGDATLTVGNFGPVILFYPNPDGGLFLKGGVGMANASLDFGAGEFDETGVGVTIGIGFDARVGRNFALTPYFDLLAGNFDFGDTNQFSFGLGFTWP